jgi:hypothetical protein
MSDEPKISIHIDSSEIDPEIPQTDRCPDHPSLEPEMGFGLAGGGYGVYTYCRMLSKTQTEE